MSHVRRRRALADESGQVLVLAAVAMVMLLAMTGFALDIGHAYLVQRQLQSGVDAAALAGAQHLPVAAEVEPVALEFGPSPGSKNAVTTVTNATTTVTMRCVQSAPGCVPASGNYNAVRVEASAPVRTLFGKVIGINAISVRAVATACSPCTAKPLDIVIALDRTGSMCAPVACTDLDNAKEGIRTFLGFMDPTLDKVGLTVFPPARNQSQVTACPNTPTSGGAYYGYDAWWPNWGWTPPGSPSYYTIVSLSNDYLVQSNGTWVLNPSSWMIQSIGRTRGGGCIRGAGSTHYASAVEEAQYELGRNGRGNVQDVIVFLSDGAANTSPTRLPLGHWRNTVFWRDRPCGAGVQAAANAKQGGTIIYTIGYDLDAGSSAPEKCRRPDANGHLNNSNPVESGYDAYTAIQAMASQTCGRGNDPCFYNKPNAGQLNTIFTKIAADLQKPAARLIDDNSQ